jgi:hypothetical protein
MCSFNDKCGTKEMLVNFNLVRSSWMSPEGLFSQEYEARVKCFGCLRSQVYNVELRDIDLMHDSVVDKINSLLGL